MKLTEKTAILIFTRTDRQEANAKAFVPEVGKNANRKIAGYFIRHAISTANKTGLPVFVTYSNEQIGHSFGERLANALENIYQKGYERVLTIGNDCPDITSQLLVDSQYKLSQSDLVLGPALDGGAYLIGISQQAYRRDEFIALQWQSEKLYDSFKQYAFRFNHSLVTLSAAPDIDSGRDLIKVMDSIPKNTKLYLAIQSIIVSKVFSDETWKEPLYSIFILNYNRLRAPPLPIL